MTLAAWTGLAAIEQDGDLLTLTSPEVTVTNEATANLAAPFQDRDGNTALGNPFTGGTSGEIAFYVAPGRYQIEATDGTNTAVWNDVVIGTLHGVDNPLGGQVPEYDSTNDRWGQRAVGKNASNLPTNAHVGAYLPSATDTGTDTYTADLGRDIADGETVRADFASANTTTTPTLENTGGTPGALTITTRDGSALWDGALSGVHTLQLASGGGSWLLLDPIGTSANTANAPVKRDANARFRAANPSAAQDVATKSYADTQISSAVRVEELASGTLGSAQSEIALNQDFSPYSMVEIQLSNFLPATDGVSLLVGLSTDSGSTYVTGYDLDFWLSGSGTPFSESASPGSTNLNFMSGGASQGNSSGEELRGRVFLFDLDGASIITGAEGSLVFRDTGGNIFRTSTGAIRNAAESYDGLRIYYNSGNIAAGSKYVIRGWK